MRGHISKTPERSKEIRDRLERLVYEMMLQGFQIKQIEIDNPMGCLFGCCEGVFEENYVMDNRLKTVVNFKNFPTTVKNGSFK